MERTQVGIIGAGPAGLMLSHLLGRAGIGNIVLERHPREYIESRIRAGVLEQGSVDLLRRTGLGGRISGIGLPHSGIEIAFGGGRHRVDFAAATGGRGVTVYAQHEVVKDLVAALLAADGDIRFGIRDARPEDTDGDNPVLRHADGGIRCDFIAGCDGFHGASRACIPSGRLHLIERLYPFAWLGILAQAPPFQNELIYARHERGFALFSMRSPEITRAYLQCAPEEDAGARDDEAIWDELDLRLGVRLERGPLLQRDVTAMRSFVAEPMRHGRLFLAGDAAHIVPPTGAKGMNLALADVTVLAAALRRHYAEGDPTGLDAYSDTCLSRVWKVQRFSWWMTRMLHRFPEDGGFDGRLQLAELDYLVSSEAAMRSLAENYVGLPLDLEGA